MHGPPRSSQTHGVLLTTNFSFEGALNNPVQLSPLQSRALGPQRPRPHRWSRAALEGARQLPPWVLGTPLLSSWAGDQVALGVGKVCFGYSERPLSSAHLTCVDAPVCPPFGPCGPSSAGLAASFPRTLTTSLLPLRVTLPVTFLCGPSWALHGSVPVPAATRLSPSPHQLRAHPPSPEIARPPLSFPNSVPTADPGRNSSYSALLCCYHI